MLLLSTNNPTTDYQQVTNFVKNRNFEHDFPFAGFQREEIKVLKFKVSQKQAK